MPLICARTPAYSGRYTVTLCPSFLSSGGNAPTTSASPPVLANGAHSEEANTICIEQSPWPAQETAPIGHYAQPKGQSTTPMFRNGTGRPGSSSASAAENRGPTLCPGSSISGRSRKHITVRVFRENSANELPIRRDPARESLSVVLFLPSLVAWARVVAMAVLVVAVSPAEEDLWAGTGAVAKPLQLRFTRKSAELRRKVRSVRLILLRY